MKIGLLIVATGKYIKFFQPLYDSIMNHFLNGHEKTFYIFTDHKELSFPKNCVITEIQWGKFPENTLYRYHYFLKQKQHILENQDYIYYMDVDSLLVNNVGDEIIPSNGKTLLGCIHPGFFKTKNPYGTPESNMMSTAYVPYIMKQYYICGGFNGGKSSEFLEMAEKIKENVENDKNNNIIAVWHDESHLNNYYAYNFHKFHLVNPEYTFPESWGQRSNLHGLVPRILALDKNHSEMRSPI